LSALAIKHSDDHLWDFSAGKANSYGLVINGSLDERLDPVVSTKKVCSYLAKLTDEFGNDTKTLIAFYGAKGELLKEGFFGENAYQILSIMSPEVQDYVRNVLTIKDFNIALDPGVSLWSESVEKYTLEFGDSLRKVASMHQMEYSELIELNPQILNPEQVLEGQIIYVNK